MRQQDTFRRSPGPKNAELITALFARGTI